MPSGNISDTEASVTLRPAVAHDEPTIAKLLELYCYDLSEAFEIDVRADGTFGYPPLPAYFREPDRRFPFLIHVGESLAGFALVARGSPVTSDPMDLDVAEFFVMRRYRQRGVGSRAAAALWDRMPGHWIVRAAERNRGAPRFWSRCIAAYTGGEFSQTERTIADRPWMVFSFEAAGRRGKL